MFGEHRSSTDSARLASLGLVLTMAIAAVIVLGSDSALATHVNCGDTITGDTTLDSDLIDCPNNGVVIGADDVTLDLNGYTIDGDGVLVDPCPEDEFCDIGVLNDGHNGVRITGGTVQEFAVGGLVVGARGNVLSNLTTVEHVFSGILLAEVVRTIVRGSSTSRNAGPDSGVGITLFESHHNRIVGNASFDNRELGIHLILSNHNVVWKNRVRDNPEDGIILQGNGNKIVANRILRNAITITIFTKPQRAVGNIVRRNHVRRAPHGGIGVDPSVERTVVKRNHVFRAGGHGILIGNPTTTVTRNEARYNDGLGIRAVEGVIDGGGNRASGNGDPRQCLNVLCSS
jgi:parallel beta-helix repeat protein